MIWATCLRDPLSAAESYRHIIHIGSQAGTPAFHPSLLTSTSPPRESSVMSTAPASSLGQSDPYIIQQLEWLQQHTESDTTRNNARDCVSLFKNNDQSDKDRTERKRRLLVSVSNTGGAKTKDYGGFFDGSCRMLELGAGLLCRETTASDRKTLNLFDFDCQSGCRISGTLDAQGPLKNSSFATRIPDDPNGRYRLLEFDDDGRCRQKIIGPAAFDSRLGLTPPGRTLIEWRSVRGPSKSCLGQSLSWILKQPDEAFMAGDGHSVKNMASDLHQVLNIAGGPIDRRTLASVKAALWRSELNHPMLQGDKSPGRHNQTTQAILSYIGSRFVTDVFRSLASQAANLEPLFAQRPDLKSHGVVCSYKTDARGDPDLSESEWLTPANPNTAVIFTR